MPVRWSPIGRDLTAANLELNAGTNQLLANRSAARNQLRDAADGFASLMRETTETTILERTTYGLARANEALGELEKARTEYRSLAEKWPQGPFAEVANSRANDLEQPNTKQFYDWLAKYEPPAPLSKEPGTPGARPDFLQEPDAGAGSLKLPSSLDDTKTPFPSLGGEPVEGASDAKSEGDAEPAFPELEMPADEPAPEAAPPEEKPSDEKPADEKPADEKPSEESPAPRSPPMKLPRKTTKSRPRARNWNSSISRVRSRPTGTNAIERAASQQPMSGDELSSQEHDILVTEDQSGVRLDWFLAQQFPAYSRVLLRKWINAAGVEVDGRRVKAAHKLRAGERIAFRLPDLPREGPQGEDIPLDVLYEDDVLAVINKPPGMVVHPGKGHWAGTLTAALQFHFDQLSTAGGPSRPGIVHRLDRDTSGVIVVAKTDQAHLRLAEQFEHREVEKEYFALCAGTIDRDRDTIDLPVGAASLPARKDGGPSRSLDQPRSADVLRSGRAVRRFYGLSRAPQDRPHSPDSPAPDQHRLPGAVRSLVRRSGIALARRNHGRSG